MFFFRHAADLHLHHDQRCDVRLLPSLRHHVNNCDERVRQSDATFQVRNHETFQNFFFKLDIRRRYLLDLERRVTMCRFSVFNHDRSCFVCKQLINLLS